MAKRKISVKKRLFLFFIIAAIAIIGVVAYVLKSKVAQVSSGCGIDGIGEEISNEKYAYFEGEKVEVPQIAVKDLYQPVLGENTAERWVEIDLSEQKIKAWEGSSLFLESLVSTGLPWWPTPTGEFRVWAKFRATKMEGGSGKYYYYLPNVPYVMFFENNSVPGYRGFSLHGTYWHNDFGRVHSHGCVNLPTSVAQQLFYWMPEKGTRVVIHE
jgi:lipoprotein-anchoring transpeptidase ErfK/SrfK